MSVQILTIPDERAKEAAAVFRYAIGTMGMSDDLRHLLQQWCDTQKKRQEHEK